MPAQASRRTLQARAVETRTRLLRAAAACFARRGYAATGTAEICRRARVSKGAFYHHFPSKQAVLLELLEQQLQTLDMQLQTARAQAGDVPGSLDLMALMAGPLFADVRHPSPLLLEFWAQAVRNPRMRPAALAPYHRYRDSFAELIQAGIQEGSLRPVEPQAAAQVIVALAVGLLLQSMLEPEGADWSRTAQAGLQLLLGGIRLSE